MRALIAVGILLGMVPLEWQQFVLAQVPADRQPKGKTAADATALDPAILEPVRVEDNKLGIRPEESDAYYEVLDHATRTNYQRQQAAARQFLKERRAQSKKYRENSDAEFPVFVDLFKHPKLYHGRLVTLRGRVRKVESYPAGRNEHGLKTLHELWLFTAQSQTNPTVIVCTSLPKGFPTDRDLIDHVSVTGYFFKKYVFRDRKVARIAPLILAQRVQWQPEEPPPAPLVPSRVWYALVIVVIMAIVLILWRLARKDREFRDRRLKREAELDSS